MMAERCRLTEERIRRWQFLGGVYGAVQTLGRRGTFSGRSRLRTRRLQKWRRKKSRRLNARKKRQREGGRRKRHGRKQPGWRRSRRCCPTRSIKRRRGQARAAGRMSRFTRASR